MRTLAIFFTIIINLLIINGYAQIPMDMKNAFVEGNSQKLSKFFNKNVELMIIQKEGVYSKAQAELMMKDFFNKHKPLEFVVELEGKSNGINYSIGNLKSSNGQFKLYISWRTGTAGQYINRINIGNYQ